MVKKGTIYRQGRGRKGEVRLAPGRWRKGASVILRGTATGVISVFVIFIIFALWPIIRQEYNYLLNNSKPYYAQKQTARIVQATDISELQKIAEEYNVGTHFSIIFPKITWGSDISANQEAEYLSNIHNNGNDLYHIKGSYFPGQIGGIVLYVPEMEIDFDFVNEDGRYLLSKLKKEDIIILLFTDKAYYYQIRGIDESGTPAFDQGNKQMEMLRIIIANSVGLNEKYTILTAVPVESDEFGAY